MSNQNFDSVINVLCNASTKIQLTALARSKGLYGFSPIVRSILINAIPRMVEQLTEAERADFDKVMRIETDRYNMLTQSSEQGFTDNKNN